MESIGQKLKEAREARGVELDQVARETNIALRYLADLESERFDEFPGESYVIGFLRNYCDYLDLDSDEFVGLYKNQKIQEADVPVSALLPSKPISERLFGGGAGKILVVLIVVVGVAGLGFGGYTLISRMPKKERQPRQVASSARTTRAHQAYKMTGTEFRGRVFAGDSISVTVAGRVFDINVQATDSAVRLETGNVVRTVELGQELSFDITDDGKADIKVFVSDLDANNPDAGAEIALETGLFDEQNVAASDAPMVVAEARTSANASSGQTVLFESSSAYPVTLNATFRGNCLFRYEIDRRDRTERLYQRSETLTVQARDGLRIWASNGNAVRLQVVAGGRTVDIELSRPGEVIVKDLRWLRDTSSGRYRFVVMDVD